MELKLVSATDGTLVLKTTGRICPNSAEQASDPLVALLGPHVFTQRVALDLSDSDFMSSTGIGWLLHCHRRFEAEGGRLEIRSVPKSVEQLFRLMQLQSVFHTT